MADVASELANKCGISPEAARKGLGLVLGLLKSVLPPESFAKIRDAVPDADNLMAAAGSGEQSSGGLANALKGALDKVLGGKGPDALLSKLGDLGVSPDQIHGFIAQLKEMLRSKLPEDVMNQVNALLPSPQEAAH